MDNLNNILIKINNRFPEFQEYFDQLEKYSEEIILFGSYAHNCEHPDSDVDMLFIGDGKRKSRKYFDFIWVKPSRVKSKSWLSSELALHIANYGIWIKGDGLWRKQTFFSHAAITKKKQRIFNRLLHLYLQKDELSLQKKQFFVQKVLLNTIRLINLYRKIPNPPTFFTIDEMQDAFPYLYSEMFKPELLGSVGKAFFNEIFLGLDMEIILRDSFNDIKKKYLGTI